VNRGAPGWLPITWLNNASGGTVMRWRSNLPARLAFDRSGTSAAIADEAGSIRFVR
jgi:hypothetical protein